MTKMDIVNQNGMIVGTAVLNRLIYTLIHSRTRSNRSGCSVYCEGIVAVNMASESSYMLDNSVNA